MFVTEQEEKKREPAFTFDSVHTLIEGNRFSNFRVLLSHTPGLGMYSLFCIVCGMRSVSEV